MFSVRDALENLTPEQYRIILRFLHSLKELAPNTSDVICTSDLGEDDFLDDEILDMTPQEKCAYDLSNEVDTWPEDKEELAHRFIKCVVLRESEEEATKMAKQFSPEQLRFLKSHIYEVLRLYGN